VPAYLQRCGQSLRLVPNSPDLPRYQTPCTDAFALPVRDDQRGKVRGVALSGGKPMLAPARSAPLKVSWTCFSATVLRHLDWELPKRGSVTGTWSLGARASGEDLVNEVDRHRLKIDLPPAAGNVHRLCAVPY